MAFNTKIKIDDQHVEQRAGTTLTLSGNTKYAIHPNFTGDTQLVDKKYVDVLVVSGITDGIVYNLATPASVTVGGICAGTQLTGKTSNEILRDILVPTLQPVVVEPSNSLSLSISGNKEVGSSNTFQVCSSFNMGSITPQYSSATPYRSGCAVSHCFVGTGVAGNHICGALVDIEIASNYIVIEGSNAWSSCVYYSAGPVVKDSAGGNSTVSPNPLTSGNTGFANASITGIYPYYWGNLTVTGASGTGRPASTAALITGGTKVVASGNGILNINFNSGDSDYIWFAVPIAYATKTTWYVSALNNGIIGGVVSAAGNLFPAPDTVNGVANGLWSGQSYKLYISNYQSSVTSTMSIS